MQIRLFTLSAHADEAEIEALNRFLRGHRILGIQQELLQLKDSAIWCFCVRYLDEIEKKEAYRGNKKDYKEILTPEVFGRFSRLREIRKELAKEDAVPAYAVFTDEELSQLASMHDMSPTAAMSVKGIGTQKLQRYGIKLIERYAQTLGEPNPFDRGT
jgi:superfamily II DNA helicase RecQ